MKYKTQIDISIPHTCCSYEDHKDKNHSKARNAGHDSGAFKHVAEEEGIGVIIDTKLLTSAALSRIWHTRSKAIIQCEA